MRRPALLLIALALPAAVACQDDGAADVRDAAADAALTDAGLGCDGALDCQDDDPCTTATCAAGRCVFGRPAAELVAGDPIPVAVGPHAVALVDGELYIAKGLEGLEIWDLSAFPLPPSLRLERHLEGEEGSVDHLAVATDRIVIGEQAGVVRALDRASGAPVGVAWAASDEVRGVVFQGGRVFVASYAKGIEVVQPGDWSAPSRTGRADTPGRASALARQGTLLAVADGLAGLALVDLTDAGPVRRADVLLETAGRAEGVALQSDRVLLAEGPAGAGIIDLLPGGPTRLATFLPAEPVADVALLGRDLGVVVAGNGALIVDLQAPEAPTVWLAASTATPAHHVAAEGRRFAVATDDAVQVFEVVCPEDAPDAGIPADGGPP
ncbi:MAG: hypothetical protein R3F60_22675 [bacterium]